MLWIYFIIVVICSCIESVVRTICNSNRRETVHNCDDAEKVTIKVTRKNTDSWNE